jgi:Tol biopolymer transport system component
MSEHVVPGDTNRSIDIFVRNMRTGEVSLVSRRTDGSQTSWPSISGAISADGRYVLFASSSRDMVPNDTNRRQDLFLRHRDADGDGTLDELDASTTVRVSLGTQGIQAQSDSYSGRLTDDGQGVVFASVSGNLVAGDTNGFPDVFFSIRSPRCPADVDESGSVDGEDVIHFLSAWDASAVEADLDSSGTIDGDDVIYFFTHFDSGC